MSAGAKAEYLGAMRVRYREAGRLERGKLLDEMVEMTRLSRKRLIRLMAGEGALSRKPRRRERGRCYGEDVKLAIDMVAESLDYVCAERLHGNLAWMAQQLERHGQLTLTEALLAKLESVSTSTIRRLLGGVEKDEYYLPRAKPVPSSGLASSIPMRRLPWDETRPGHFEVDLVFHSGSDASGEFACSLHMVDVATGWCEAAAILGRSQLVVQDGFERIRQRLPFSVVQLHPDNGSEFLNHHILRLWQEWVPTLEWSRSRPYDSNDNRFVEQKNSSVVRAYFGHERLDTAEHVLAMNRFYDSLHNYYNLFQPVMRLAAKEIVRDDQGSLHARRHYSQALTPLDRLCATDAIDDQDTQALLAVRHGIDPRRLRVELHEAADAILRLPKAPRRPPKAQNVYLTLLPGRCVAAQSGLSVPVDDRELLPVVAGCGDVDE